MTEKANALQEGSLQSMLQAAMSELRTIAPKYVNVQRMVTLAIEAKMRNSVLAQCSPVSVLNFCKKCAEAGTDRVGAGGMWPVPFWNSKANCYDMTPIPDWRLLIDKARRAGAIKHATAECVYANDEFDYERGLEPRLVHKPARVDRGVIIAAYCVYTLPDNTKDFAVMDWQAEVIPIRNRSKAWQAWVEKKRSCPWVTDEAEMGKKTVVKRTMKIFEGASPELTMLLEADNVVNGYVDDIVERVPVAMPREIAPRAEEASNAETEEQSEAEVLPCSTCGKPCVERTNSKTGAKFWSCASYPTCKGRPAERVEKDNPVDSSGSPTVAPDASAGPSGDEPPPEDVPGDDGETFAARSSATDRIDAAMNAIKAAKGDKVANAAYRSLVTAKKLDISSAPVEEVEAAAAALEKVAANGKGGAA